MTIHFKQGLILSVMSVGAFYSLSAYPSGGFRKFKNFNLKPYLVRASVLQADFVYNRCRVFVVENRTSVDLEVVLIAGLGTETRRSTNVYRLDRLENGSSSFSQAKLYRTERALFLEELAEFETLVNQKIQKGLCHSPDFIP